VIERIPAIVNADPAIRRWGRGMNETFLVEVTPECFLVSVREGEITRVEKGPFVQRSWRFAIRAKRERWERHWRKPPEPGWHDLFALLRRGDVSFEGDQRVLMAYLLYIKLLLAAPRKA